MIDIINEDNLSSNIVAIYRFASLLGHSWLSSVGNAVFCAIGFPLLEMLFYITTVWTYSCYFRLEFNLKVKSNYTALHLERTVDSIEHKVLLASSMPLYSINLLGQFN